MESYEEYAHRIDNKCKRDVEAEYDSLKAFSILALIGVGILIAGAEALNWTLSWKISIRGLAIGSALFLGLPHIFATVWRVRELRLRALRRRELGWPIEQLRADLTEKLSEIKSDLGKLDSIERKVEWLRAEIVDDLKHEIEMHEIRTSH